MEKHKAKKVFLLKIPKGVDDGTRIEFLEKAKLETKEWSTGDLYLFISVDNHSIFKRSDEHLYFELPITFTDAALGTSVEVPSIDGGKAKIKIPSGTQHGKQLRLRGKGMPLLRGNGYGDLYIKIITEVPSNLNSKQKELLEEFRKIETEKSSPIIRNFFEKAKKILEKFLNFYGCEEIMSAIFLLAVLFLVLPSFLNTNSKLKQFIQNISIWTVIVLIIVVLIYLII